jgi:hypothetical protein
VGLEAATSSSVDYAGQPVISPVRSGGLGFQWLNEAGTGARQEFQKGAASMPVLASILSTLQEAGSNWELPTSTNLMYLPTLAAIAVGLFFLMRCALAQASVKTWSYALLIPPR